jgi:hypothetical protein
MKSSRINIFSRFILRARHQPRGQSFVELMLVVVILALIMAGVVEYGFMLNNYLHVLDGAREAARYSSSSTPFHTDPSGKIDNYYVPEFYYITVAKAATTMMPVQLDPEHPDDIVISVFSVSGGSIVRFPSANGWSLCAHYASFAAYFPVLTPPEAVPEGLRALGWRTGCTARSSQLTTSDVLSRLDPSAPNSGVLVVEVFYNYPQLLKLPVITSVIPDPVPMAVFSIMPISSAEPTQVGP